MKKKLMAIITRIFQKEKKDPGKATRIEISDKTLKLLSDCQERLTDAMGTSLRLSEDSVICLGLELLLGGDDAPMTPTESKAVAKLRAREVALREWVSKQDLGWEVSNYKDYKSWARKAGYEIMSQHAFDSGLHVKLNGNILLKW